MKMRKIMSLLKKGKIEDQAAEVEAETVVAEASADVVTEAMPFEADADYVEEKPVAAAPLTRVQTTGTAMAAAQPQATPGKMEAELDEEGYEGFDDEGRQYPQISLVGEAFTCKAGWRLGHTFDCVILNARKQWMIAPDGALTDAEKAANPATYTYDKRASYGILEGVMNCAGSELVTDKVAGWASQDWGFKIKEYRECLAMVVAPGEDWDGEEVMLHISTTSLDIFKGFGRSWKRKGVLLKAFVTTISLGTKIMGANPFHPWAFARKVEEEVSKAANK
jgi:hypothetical protein